MGAGQSQRGSTGQHKHARHPEQRAAGTGYRLTALVGAITFICAGVYLAISATTAALLAMAVTFLFRSITIAFNWRTAPVSSGAIFTQGEDGPK